jgi:hypothetical protein
MTTSDMTPRKLTVPAEVVMPIADQAITSLDSKAGALDECAIAAVAYAIWVCSTSAEPLP